MKHFVIFVFFIFSACVHGPKDDRMTTAQAFSGDSYNQGMDQTSGQAGVPGHSPVPPVSVAAIPVLERKSPMVKLTGQVSFGEGISTTQLKNEKVVLKSKDKVLAFGTTDGDGQFKILVNIPNGDYLLELDSKRYVGQTKVRVSGLEVPSLNIQAMKK